MAIFCGPTFSKVQLLIGLLQFATMWAYVGTIWALAWSLLIFWRTWQSQGSPNPAAVLMMEATKFGKNPYET